MGVRTRRVPTSHSTASRSATGKAIRWSSTRLRSTRGCGTSRSGRGETNNAWTHSPEERVIERFTRNSKNYLTYQYTVIDPVVLLKPLVSAPHTWTLAQDPNDVWSEYLCTSNEDAFAFEKMTPEGKKEAEERMRGGGPVTIESAISSAFRAAETPPRNALVRSRPLCRSVSLSPSTCDHERLHLRWVPSRRGHEEGRQPTSVTSPGGVEERRQW